MFRIYFLYIFSFFNVVLFLNVEAAVSQLPPVDKPAKFACQKGCYIPELDIVLPFNKPYSPKDGKNCLQYECETNGYTSIYSCGVIGVEPPCRVLPGNKNLAYPKCCDSEIYCPPTTVKPKPKPDPCIGYPPPRDALPVNPDQVGAIRPPIRCPPRPRPLPVPEPEPVPVIENPVGPEGTTPAADATSATADIPPEIVRPRCPPGFGCVDPIFPGTSDS